MHHINQTHASGNSERTIESSSSKREEDVETKYEETVLQKQEKYQTPCVQKASEQKYHVGLRRSKVVVKVQSHALSIQRKMVSLTQAAGAMPVGRCRVRSTSGAFSFPLRTSSRVVLHLRWSSSVAARHDHHPHRAEQQVGAGRRGIMTEVTVVVSARRRADVGRLMQRGRRSGADVADQTDYAIEKLAYGQAVLDLQTSAR